MTDFLATRDASHKRAGSDRGLRCPDCRNRWRVAVMWPRFVRRHHAVDDPDAIARHSLAHMREHNKFHALKRAIEIASGNLAVIVAAEQNGDPDASWALLQHSSLIREAHDELQDARAETNPPLSLTERTQQVKIRDE